MRGKGKRFSWKPSVKTGRCCPARLLVSKKLENITVSYFKTHLGHNFSLRTLRISPDERAQIAKRIESGVSSDRILDDIRDSFLDAEKLERVHLLEKRDLYNIIRDFKINPERAHQDDYISTAYWVETQQKLGEDSPVLLYKQQGDEHEGLENDDFVLAIMTRYQQNLVGSLYNTCKICIDSTHGTSGYNFQLTSIVTVDEFGAGCPVAMCLSARVNEKVMSCFLSAVKNKVGIITATEFMSDDAPTFYNAWCDVMGLPQRKLLCTWHVDRAWRSQLNKIKSKYKQADIYKACRTLLGMLDEEDFRTALENFLILCEEDEDCIEFGKYFMTYYAQRPQEWAYCFRKGACLNTNMFLEALHKKLKYKYLDGKKNRRIDKTIFMIMQFSRDAMFECEIRKFKNKPTSRMRMVRKSHIAAMKIPVSKIKQESENLWNVKSSTGPDTYVVYIVNDDNLCKGCPFTCPDCHACPHRTSCTCADSLIKGNVCKHVHTVALNSGTKLSLFQEEEVETPFPTVDPIKMNHLRVEDNIKLQTLWDTVGGLMTHINPDSKKKLITMMESCKNFCKTNLLRETADGVSEKSEPHNKRPEQQRRVNHSVVKKRKKGETPIEKPTTTEVIHLKNLLGRKSSKIPILIRNFEHCYSK